MESRVILGKSIREWQREYPLLRDIIQTSEVCWLQPNIAAKKQNKSPFSLQDIEEAEARLQRFAPFFAAAFPETGDGMIESPLQTIPNMQQELSALYNVSLSGKLFIKLDSHLPISGSIKARGGVYEVIKHAERLAVQHGFLQVTDHYAKLYTKQLQQFFSRFSLAVGSTGNLGLSIGIIGSKLGFQVTVHMSADAKQWKKELLRSHGVIVKEYDTDYSKAVAAGRKEAQRNDHCYFIDDENSQDLFLGYAVAALRLQKQLIDAQVVVDQDHPLFVYLPCGVGGGPGGVAFGLQLLYGEHVHCFFAEPTHSPSVLLGMMTGYHEKVSVQDFGIDNRTAADGLAVGTPSGFICRMMQHRLTGIYTVEDQTLFKLLRLLADTENIWLEPSALAGMYGPVQLFRQPTLQQYSSHTCMEQATHIVWATGGSMVPEEQMKEYYVRGF